MSRGPVLVNARPSAMRHQPLPVAWARRRRLLTPPHLAVPPSAIILLEAILHLLHLPYREHQMLLGLICHCQDDDLRHASAVTNRPLQIAIQASAAQPSMAIPAKPTRRVRADARSRQSLP